MSTQVENKTVHVALVGNPNTGKSTLFNALCGMRQRVGNYPGVTVEKKVGRCEFDGGVFHIIDLPGSYSLAPRSPDEMIAVDVLLGLRQDVDLPDAIICIVDASNLERNLYLVSQVLELNRPTVLALNMTDVAGDKGVSIDARLLSERLGIEVVEIQANRKRGLSNLREAVSRVFQKQPRPFASPFPREFQDEVTKLEATLAHHGHRHLPRYLVERLLLDSSGFLVTSCGFTEESPLFNELEASRERLRASGFPVPAVEAISRYEWVGKVTEGVVSRTVRDKELFSDRLDRLLTHRVGGTLVFLILMLGMFAAVFYIGEAGAYWIEQFSGWVVGLVVANMSEGAFRSLVVDGVIAGVGGVVTFLPQIFVLFLFIAILEDCGYMARAAYLMDKLMSRVGLSGKSFIPLLSSHACAIPGIISARVIENPRDRLITILVAPLMSCSARLPVYTLLISAFIPNLRLSRFLPGLQALVMLAMYMSGIVAAIAVAYCLKRTLFKGPTPPFVMELPSYKIPGVGLVLHRMLESGWSFVRRAGTLILAVSILVWAAAYYPHDINQVPSELIQQRAQLEKQLDATSAAPSTQDSAIDPQLIEEQLAAVDNQIEGELLRHSYLGRMGRVIEPAVRPLGWDWRIGCAVIASFPAREVIVATLGVIYNLGQGQDEESLALRDTLRRATWEGTSRPVFNIPVALSIMIFFSLCAQCVSTLVVMRRETNSWRWPVFTFVYMTGLAYVAAFVVYQSSRLLLS
jgi:ferrous iron transport protein B